MPALHPDTHTPEDGSEPEVRLYLTDSLHPVPYPLSWYNIENEELPASGFRVRRSG